MIDALVPAIPHIKALHVSMLSIWCAGLFALPLVLARHDPAIGQQDYAIIRRVGHYGYIFLVTPCALFAIGSGLLLLFLREAFEPWMFAKLVFVALLVALHAWVGRADMSVAEDARSEKPLSPRIPHVALTALIAAILTLVLAKPDLGAIPMPGWLTEPVGLHLPFDVPRR
ncbi:CopD family protein [Marivita sp. GX14005]|uniref:CopD family protein n=1 Tax=Marivita sp. GX14005 TaxID=2942276 RepID=UPI002018C3DE|nr:CopD family protein [Marivita sp. GX14005]MCL3883358.1 CopD family protein [Marivita sp. GX14005]